MPVAIGLVCVVAPELLGGGRGWAIAITATLAGIAAAATAWCVHRAQVEVRWTPVTLAVGAMVAWTVVQALPLPVAIVRFIAPDSVSHQTLAHGWLGEEPPTFVALSRSSTATWAAAVQIAALLGISTAAAGAIALGHRRNLLRAITLSTVLMAFVGLGHTAVGAERIFGIWTPRNVDPRLLAPLTNENHLGGFLGMGVPIAAGLALEARGVGRSVWALAAAILTVTTVLTMSRGALVSLVVGIVVLAAMVAYRSRRARGGPPRTALATAIVSVALALGFAVVMAGRALRAEWWTVTADKFRIAALGLDLLAQRPWIGVGRGAYSEALVELHGSAFRFEYPENLLVQWTSEWGLLFGAAMLVVLGRAWVGAARQARSPSRMGALAATASIAVHDQVDFALERLGVSVCAVVALMCATVPSRRSVLEPVNAGRPIRPFEMAFVVTFVLLLAVGVGPRLHGWDVHELQAWMIDRIANRRWIEFDALAREAILAHPSEPAFPLLIGHAALLRGDRSTPVWLNRAMILAPHWPSPHHEAARWLAAIGAPGQAWIELREAERRLRFSSVGVACALARHYPETVPAERWRHDEVGAPLLDRVAECLGLDSPVAARIDDALAETTLPGVLIRRARRYLAHGRADDALRELDRIPAGTAPDAALFRADAHSQAGRHERAIGILLEAERSGIDRERVLHRLAVEYAHLRREEEMREVITEVLGMAAGSPRRIAQAYVLLGQLERQLGNRGKALHAFEQAYRIDPESQALDALADVAAELGDARRAYQAYAELCRREGPASAACARQRQVHPDVRPSAPP